MWSPSFVNLLEALRVRWNFTAGEQEVRRTEEDVRSRHKGIHFPEPWRPPTPEKCQTLHIPRSLRQRLGEMGPPAPPPLPNRLACTVPYVQDAPWKETLAPPEVVRSAAEFAHQPEKWVSLPRRRSERERDLATESYQTDASFASGRGGSPGMRQRVGKTMTTMTQRTYGMVSEAESETTEEDDEEDDGMEQYLSSRP